MSFLEEILYKKLRELNILNESFRIKDLGELKYFLGLEVTKSKKGIHLCQGKYVIDILEETWMVASKPCFTPLMFNNKILLEVANKLQNPNPYRKLIGKLLYLTNTRSEIGCIVHLLIQFV